jgi:hypothetical protein
VLSNSVSKHPLQTKSPTETDQDSCGHKLRAPVWPKAAPPVRENCADNLSGQTDVSINGAII